MKATSLQDKTGSGPWSFRCAGACGGSSGGPLVKVPYCGRCPHYARACSTHELDSHCSTQPSQQPGKVMNGEIHTWRQRDLPKVTYPGHSRGG